MSSHLRDESVDTKLRSPIELLLAHGTVTQVTVVPVLGDTGLAEVVSTWSRDRISEHIQTDRTQELIFIQETAAGSHFYTGERSKLKP